MATRNSTPKPGMDLRTEEQHRSDKMQERRDAVVTLMKFTIGGAVYEVRFARLDGKLGLCVFDDEMIYLSPYDGKRHIATTLAHEVAHAIINEFPPPDSLDGEKGATWLGSAMRLYADQLHAQGGCEEIRRHLD